MKEYLNYKGCLMSFLQNSLNDKNIQKCGKCANCLSPLDKKFSLENNLRAIDFLKKDYIIFDGMKQVELDALNQYDISEIQICQPGRILSRWEDSGWGKIMANDKHKGEFSDELVEAFVDMIQNWNPSIEWITCVPSLKHTTLVPNFAKKVGKKLGLPFIDAVKKNKTK